MGYFTDLLLLFSISTVKKEHRISDKITSSYGYANPDWQCQLSVDLHNWGIDRPKMLQPNTFHYSPNIIQKLLEYKWPKD